MATQNSRWVSVDDAAEHLGVARDTIYRWIEGRGLPAHRVGRLWKFQIPEIDEWVKSGQADSSGASASRWTNALEVIAEKETRNS